MVRVSSGNRFGTFNVTGTTATNSVDISTSIVGGSVNTNPVLRKGEDGFSPLATVTQTTSGATISITDVNGTTTAEIKTLYIHEQGEASDTWTIEHNLNKFPSVSLVDTAGGQFQGRVDYIDENNLVVTMNGATKGKAYLN